MKRITFILLFCICAIVMVYASKEKKSFVDQYRPVGLVGIVNGANVDNLPSMKNLSTMMHDGLKDKISQVYDGDFKVIACEIIQEENEYWLLAKVELVDGRLAASSTKLRVEYGGSLFLTDPIVCIGGCFECKWNGSIIVPDCLCLIQPPPTGYTCMRLD